MVRWSEAEDEIIRNNGHLGPEECSRIIHRRFGIRRTPGATLRRAYRINARTLRHNVCSECGKPISSYVRNTRLCKSCNKRALARKKRQERELLEEIERNEAGRDVWESNAEYQREKQRLARKAAQMGFRIVRMGE